MQKRKLGVWEEMQKRKLGVGGAVPPRLLPAVSRGIVRGQPHGRRSLYVHVAQATSEPFFVVAWFRKLAPILRSRFSPSHGLAFTPFFALSPMV